MSIVSLLRLQDFTWVVYRTESLPKPDVEDLVIEMVGPGQNLKREQKDYLRSHMSALNLWYLLRLMGLGLGWVFLAKADGEYAHYTFVCPASRYRRKVPLIKESKALMISAALTEERFRGRAIYPRVLRHVVGVLGSSGWEPFYIITDTTNQSSIRGIEKAGFRPCGVWAGKRWPWEICIRGRRIAD